jgi:hypothetical protein
MENTNKFGSIKLKKKKTHVTDKGTFPNIETALRNQ